MKTLRRPDPATPPLKPPLRAVDRQHTAPIVEVDGVRLRFVERGAGDPAVILLHGNGGMAEDMVISGVLAASALRNHRTLAFDRPGYGGSERPRDRRWTPQAQATLLLHALSRLGIERPVVVGHSGGAQVALAFALDHPGSVRGLVLVAGYYFRTGRADIALASLLAAPVLGDVLRHTVLRAAGPSLAPRLARRAFAPGPVPARFTAGYPLATALTPRAARAAFEDAAALEPTSVAFAPRYGGLRLPVAIVAGAGDRLVDPFQQSARLHEELPDSALAVVPGQGHMVHYGVPDRVAAAADALAARGR